MDRKTEDQQTGSMTEEEWIERHGTAKSIVDPAAEEAKRHLSWTADQPDVGHVDARYVGIESAREGQTLGRDYQTQTFVEYHGNLDGTFVVTVHLSRGDVGVVQSAQSTSDRREAVRDIYLTAYEKAERALEVLSDLGHVEEI